jgi:superoxide dismutase, Fe-Mn family
MEKQENSRRDFIKKSAIIGIGGIAASIIPSGILKAAENKFLLGDDKFTLPALPYAYDSLEPFIDKLTMEIHHLKHHGAYVEKLNKALEGKKHEDDIEKLCRNISKYDRAVRNNGGGHFNHSLFWKLMKPNGGGSPTGKIGDAINSSFGSFDAFKTKFNETAMKHFGSGWTWAVIKDKKLEIGSTPNQDNPLMEGICELKGKPVLGLDVWEHAYYLKHQNKRADYINDWWNVVNWDEVNKLV